ncbi:FKBP-type peptidyl-prolyl cis-trans isomerase [Aggregatilinea lenta]|uniref:FKBP-type peptidyl-prolyl cis-trans isomerase n=1 Tax=Aggregatilinea lenta TaxID=913108 RepID=UPI000E5A186B|nr:peptidylprolyl isomerase [Aggregatilinea lenta]
MAEAKSSDTVRVHYTGRLEDGTVFDSSLEREPLEFTLGEGQVIPGFEEGVVGMNPGASKTIEIDVERAYGPYRDDMLLAVDRGQFPENIEPNVGQRLQLRQPDGQTMLVTVSEVGDEQVTLDANHPLAGKNLIFDVELVEIV